MATLNERKMQIREQILKAAEVYSKNLAGKTFLYVYGEEMFEILFATNKFSHLTGVTSKLSAEEFYKKAKNRTLTTNQFYFDEKHTLRNAGKKLPCLLRLPELTNTMVCIIKCFKTLTITYKIGVTNLEFTLALTEEPYSKGINCKHWYVPMSLRVKDKAIEKSEDGEIVDFIFCKNVGETLYREIVFQDDKKKIPKSIERFLQSNLLQDNKN